LSPRPFVPFYSAAKIISFFQLSMDGPMEKMTGALYLKLLLPDFGNN
jgi:hypothetical protein